jgi:hypothetical protein
MKSLFAKRKMTIVLSIVFIVAMLFLANSAWSQATRYCVHSETLVTSEGGRVWFSGWVYHNHGMTGSGSQWGDLNADMTFTQNLEINFNTYKGHVYGQQTLSNVSVLSYSGGFEGLFNAEWIAGGGGEWEGEYIAHGSGGFEGMKLFQTCIGFIDAEVCEGFILDPHGNIPDMPCE